jgi:hypothetical protein
MELVFKVKKCVAYLKYAIGLLVLALHYYAYIALVLKRTINLYDVPCTAGTD